MCGMSFGYCLRKRSFREFILPQNYALVLNSLRLESKCSCYSIERSLTMARIREIVRPSRKKFQKRLEDRGEAIARRVERREWTPSISSLVEREVALTVRQIASVRTGHDYFENKLRKLEEAVDRDYATINTRMGYQTILINTERNRLRQQRWNLEHDLRQIALSKEEKLRGLHDRLLVLLNRHRQLRL
jgi:hypothetical protein